MDRMGFTLMNDLDRALLWMAAWFNYLVDMVVWCWKVATIRLENTATVLIVVVSLGMLVYIVTLLNWSALW